MDFTAPHFILFESIDDPFSGIIGRMFKHADYPFERVEVRSGDDVKSLGVPLGLLPALQFDGVTIAGLMPICRSVATRTGLDGSSLKESSEIDMIVNFIETEMDKLRPIILNNLVQEMETEIDNFLNKLAPFLDARLQVHNGSKTVVGKNLSWADFVLICFLKTLVQYVDNDPTILFESYPHLLSYYYQNQNL